MKKLLVSMLLAVALVAPVFAADQGAMELDIKAGFNLMSKVDVDRFDEANDVDPAFTATADFFYYVMPQLAVGAGAEYVFNAEVKDSYGAKVGFVNLYAQAKYVFETGNDIFNNVYPLVQIGYGIVSLDNVEDMEVDSNGLYWGIGVGTTIKECYMVELLYSNNNATFGNPYGPETTDVKYSTIQLKVGYKFAF